MNSDYYNYEYTKTEYIFDCNWTRTQNHLVRKQTLNHLAKQKHTVKIITVFTFNLVNSFFEIISKN